MGFADPDDLERLATSIEARADDVRADCHQARTAATAVRWESDGARDYRTQCAASRQLLLADADDLDAAAAALRRHAAEVRSRIDFIQDTLAKLKDKGEEVVTDAIGIACDTYDDVTGVVGDGVDTVKDGVGGVLHHFGLG